MTITKVVLWSILLPAATTVVAANSPDEDAVKEEMKKLQGTLQVTKFVDHSEQAAPAEEIKSFTFEFKEDRLTLREDKDDAGHEMKYTLDPSKKPKWIDLDMGKPIGIAEGIYRIEDDELTICVIGGTRNDKAAPRPKEFKASKREKYSLFTLKKIKQ